MILNKYRYPSGVPWINEGWMEIMAENVDHAGEVLRHAWRGFQLFHPNKLEIYINGKWKAVL